MCVCVGGGGGGRGGLRGLVCWGWCLRRSTEFFGGEVKVDHIRMSWCDRVKVFDIVAHVYSTVLGNYSTSWGEPEQAYIVDCSIAAIISQ